MLRSMDIALLLGEQQRLLKGLPRGCASMLAFFAYSPR
jgi:hypothetical protein